MFEVITVAVCVIVVAELYSAHPSLVVLCVAVGLLCYMFYMSDKSHDVMIGVATAVSIVAVMNRLLKSASIVGGVDNGKRAASDLTSSTAMHNGIHKRSRHDVIDLTTNNDVTGELIDLTEDYDEHRDLPHPSTPHLRTTPHPQPPVAPREESRQTNSQTNSQTNKQQQSDKMRQMLGIALANGMLDQRDTTAAAKVADTSMYNVDVNELTVAGQTAMLYRGINPKFPIKPGIIIDVDRITDKNRAILTNYRDQISFWAYKSEHLQDELVRGCRSLIYDDFEVHEDEWPVVDISNFSNVVDSKIRCNRFRTNKIKYPSNLERLTIIVDRHISEHIKVTTVRSNFYESFDEICALRKLKHLTIDCTKTGFNIPRNASLPNLESITMIQTDILPAFFMRDFGRDPMSLDMSPTSVTMVGNRVINPNHDNIPESVETLTLYIPNKYYANSYHDMTHLNHLRRLVVKVLCSDQVPFKIKVPPSVSEIVVDELTKNKITFENGPTPQIRTIKSPPTPYKDFPLKNNK